MAIKRFRGRAGAVAQVERFTPDAPVGPYPEAYTILVNTKSVTYQAQSGDTVANVVAGLVTAWSGSPYGETADAEATNENNTALLLSASSPGRPFVVQDGTANLTQLQVEAGTGPEAYGDPNNYDPTGFPIAGDTVYIEDDVLYSLDALSGTVLAKLVFAEPVQVGLPENQGSYPEYRIRYLDADVGTGIVLVRNSGVTGCLDLVGNHATIDIEDCRDLNLRELGASGVIDVRAGVVRLAPVAGDVCAAATVWVRGGTLEVGTSATITALTVGDGSVDVRGTVTTLTVSGNGRVVLHEESVVTTIVISGAGTVDYRATANPTAVTINGGGTFDLGANFNPTTITTLTVTNGKVLDPNSVLTVTTNGVAGKVVEVKSA